MVFSSDIIPAFRPNPTKNRAGASVATVHTKAKHRRSRHRSNLPCSCCYVIRLIREAAEATVSLTERNSSSNSNSNSNTNSRNGNYSSSYSSHSSMKNVALSTARPLSLDLVNTLLKYSVGARANAGCSCCSSGMEMSSSKGTMTAGLEMEMVVGQWVMATLRAAQQQYNRSPSEKCGNSKSDAQSDVGGANRSVESVTEREDSCVAIIPAPTLQTEKTIRVVMFVKQCDELLQSQSRR